MYCQPCDVRAPDDGRADHMYAALENWYEHAPHIANRIMDMYQALMAQDEAKLENACEHVSCSMQ